jgi:four helix bundle protein
VRDKSRKGYHRIVAWQRAHALVLLVYDLTEKFPRHELFGLTRQLRDAAISVPANIVEGYSRGSSKQYLYHLNVAWGSLAEVEYYLELALDRGYITSEEYESAEALRRETAYLLHQLILSIGRKEREETEGTEGTRGPEGPEGTEVEASLKMVEKRTEVLREPSEIYAVASRGGLDVFDIFYPPFSSPSASFGSPVSSGSSVPFGSSVSSDPSVPS